MIYLGNWGWIREIKSPRFFSQKLSREKEEQIREQKISISCCCCAFQPPLFKIDVYCFEDFVVAREYVLVGSIERSHRGRVFALSKQKRSIIIAFRRRAQNKRVLRIADKKTKKNISAYREQRHRVSSVDRFFAGREGHVRSSRNRFHGTLSLQAFGLGNRRFRARVKGGLDERSHFSFLFLCVLL